MHLLSRREHTRKEINNKLKKKAEDPSLLNTVLDALEEEHLQSDERFMESYTRMRAKRGYGPVRIKQELREKGVGADDIVQVINSPEYDWCELAIEARHKKFGVDKARDAKEKAKQMNFLQYRGFTSEHIKAAMSVD